MESSDHKQFDPKASPCIEGISWGQQGSCKHSLPCPVQAWDQLLLRARLWDQALPKYPAQDPSKPQLWGFSLSGRDHTIPRGQLWDTCLPKAPKALELKLLRLWAATVRQGKLQQALLRMDDSPLSLATCCNSIPCWERCPRCSLTQQSVSACRCVPTITVCKVEQLCTSCSWHAAACSAHQLLRMVP